MEHITNTHSWLLQEARQLYEKHNLAEHRDLFNVISVLCNERDEENLHSRFLATLLDHRSSDAQRRNLQDLFPCVLCLYEFDYGTASIRLEYYKIDILVISHDGKKAVVIENKIDADDQDKQLERYYNTMRRQGCHEVHLVYLTLDGHEPSPDSIGDLDCRSICYRKDILPWLERCKHNAQEEPSLRESIAQYIRIVQKLTGTDVLGIYMNDLKELCLKDDNLILVHDLREAMKQAQIVLLSDFWENMIDTLKAMVPNLSPGSWAIVKPGKPVSDSVQDAAPDFKPYIQSHGAEIVLRFPLVSANSGMGIGADAMRTYFGVYCDVANKEQRQRLLDAFAGIDGLSSSRWPWYRYSVPDLNQKYPTKEDLKMLSNHESSAQYAASLAFEFKNTVIKTLGDSSIE